MNTNWRTKYFLWYCLTTTVRKFNNSNIGAVNAIQTKFVYLHKIGEQIKSFLLIKTLLQLLSLFLLQISFAYGACLYFNMGKKIWRYISFSSTCFCYYWKILITIIRFDRYYPFLASNSTFMTDSMYLGAIQIYWNLNEHYYYLISSTSVILEIDANYSPFHSMNMLPFHIRLERLKLIY